jgi:hypothetical protein
MKKKMEILGKFGVVLFALVAAFAFTTPKDLTQEKHGYDSDRLIWVNLTGQMPGQGVYDCLQPLTEVCTRETPEFTGTPVEDGIIIFN